MFTEPESSFGIIVSDRTRQGGEFSKENKAADARRRQRGPRRRQREHRRAQRAARRGVQDIIANYLPTFAHLTKFSRILYSEFSN